MELGFNVQIRNERENTNADIYLPDIKKRIEIKSGKYSLIDNFLTTEASFGKGKQLIDNKFDYLVFVTFDETIEGKVNEMFVFTYKAMKELINYSRPEISGFNTNTYLLNIFKKYEEYKKWIKNNNSKSFYLEDNLNKNPEEYNNAWDKIKA